MIFYLRWRQFLGKQGIETGKLKMVDTFLEEYREIAKKSCILEIDFCMFSFNFCAMHSWLWLFWKWFVFQFSLKLAILFYFFSNLLIVIKKGSWNYNILLLTRLNSFCKCIYLHPDWSFSLLFQIFPTSALPIYSFVLSFYSENGRPPLNINKTWYMKL